MKSKSLKWNESKKINSLKQSQPNKEHAIVDQLTGVINKDVATDKNKLIDILIDHGVVFQEEKSGYVATVKLINVDSRIKGTKRDNLNEFSQYTHNNTITSNNNNSNFNRSYREQQQEQQQEQKNIKDESKEIMNNCNKEDPCQNSEYKMNIEHVKLKLEKYFKEKESYLQSQLNNSQQFAKIHPEVKKLVDKNKMSLTKHMLIQGKFFSASNEFKKSVYKIMMKFNGDSKKMYEIITSVLLNKSKNHEFINSSPKISQSPNLQSSSRVQEAYSKGDEGEEKELEEEDKAQAVKELSVINEKMKSDREKQKNKEGINIFAPKSDSFTPQTFLKNRKRNEKLLSQQKEELLDYQTPPRIQLNNDSSDQQTPQNASWIQVSQSTATTNKQGTSLSTSFKKIKSNMTASFIYNKQYNNQKPIKEDQSPIQRVLQSSSHIREEYQRNQPSHLSNHLKSLHQSQVKIRNLSSNCKTASSQSEKKFAATLIGNSSAERSASCEKNQYSLHDMGTQELVEYYNSVQNKVLNENDPYLFTSERQYS